MCAAQQQHGASSCHSMSISDARGSRGILLSSGQVPVWLCGALSVLDVFWFGHDLHLLPSIALIPGSSAQPSSSSFPKENKEWLGLNQAKIVFV